MDSGALVIVNLNLPKEKFWGLLISLTPAGVTIRGIDVGMFEAWARQFSQHSDHDIGPVTVFFPLHRIEKIFGDERVGPVASYAERFQELVGSDVRRYLVLTAAADDGPVS